MTIVLGMIHVCYLKLYLHIVAQPEETRLENALIKRFSHTRSLSPEMKQTYPLTSKP